MVHIHDSGLRQDHRDLTEYLHDPRPILLDHKGEDVPYRVHLAAKPDSSLKIMPDSLN